MWKLILGVICLICVVYGAPQAPAEEKYEPVMPNGRKKIIFSFNFDEAWKFAFILLRSKAVMIFSQFCRFSSNIITRWKIPRKCYFSIRTRPEMHKER